MTARSGKLHLRQRIAYEAARLMREGSAAEHGLALRKAASHLGAHNKRLWPSNAEVEEALHQELRLFRKEQPEQLRLCRERALRAMRAFARFHPRLVGPVLDGTADRAARISLHLFADTPEEVVLALLEQGIPWEDRERVLRYADGVRISHPMFSFVAGEIPIELIVLPPRDRQTPPLGPLTDRPERGAGIAKLQDLLATVPVDEPL